MTIDEIKKLCKKYDVSPSKSKGQNFLLCDDALENIIKAGNLKKDDVVLEIGPGFGFLTKKLADRAKVVISIELDDNLIMAAKEILKDAKNINFIHGDILKLADNRIKDLISKSIDEKEISDNVQPYKIITNLPYSITGAFLKKFLSAAYRPAEMIVMLQKEVAARICASPGQLSILGVSAQYYARPEILHIVPRNCFYPAPEVDSAIVKLAIKKEFIKGHLGEEKKFFQILKIGFSAKRKMLKNNLFNGLRGTDENIDMRGIENILSECGLNAKARPQDLAVEDWIKLAGKIK